MGNSKRTNDTALFRMALISAALILVAAGIVIGVADALKKPEEAASSEQATVIEDEPSSTVTYTGGWKSPIQISATLFCRVPNPMSIICDVILTEHRIPTARFSPKEPITTRALPIG